MARANLTPERLYAAAAELADAHGFEAVTASAVARHFGVQPASLYSHVRDRDALLDGVQQYALGELGDRVSIEIAGRSGVEALRGFAEANRAYALERPGAWQALQRTASIETATSTQGQRLGALTIALVRGYGLDESQLVHAARFIGATLNGFLAQNKAGAFDHRDTEVETSWQAALAALDRALRSWPTRDEAL
ncbi:TetR/AcrR family transcriptional regulator [Leucobacter sp. UT-8R-CII-1-4]|uniref:TetR/AcrR family transcriptional regulator n=1 Tax=Leucobacter sp. UT-8R-CII-1-4 TaxID=3040075 RepID=UPI0024A814B9|nr:TetR/AcrR family transcriptional regulator [Leucobacter sp. UT-8R-CII-1-4]MDI6023366.1 TetR/AcrR family transcriptional regulator [Leucobacter sp. UT-8R-CII-1-4]